MVTINLNRYFVEKFYDDNFLKFLRDDHYDQNEAYMLTVKNDGKLSQLYNVTMELKFKSWIGGDNKREVFELADEQLRLLNRIAEQETNWIVYPLFVVANQYFKISQRVKVTNEKEDKNMFLERCGRTIHRSFNLCLNDRNPNYQENRKIGCHLFADLEFALYHKLENRDMMKNLVKVLQSRLKEIPNLSESLAAEHRSHIVLYNYNMGEYYGCYESDFNKAYTYLEEALLECSIKGARCDKQIDKILILLIPFAMLTRRLYPNFKTINGITNKHHRVAQRIYEPIVKSLLNGNLKEYDSSFSKNEIFFLQNGLYVAMSLIRELIFLKLIKNCWLFNGKENILSLNTISCGYLKSLQGQKRRRKLKTAATERDELLDELECHLANLISKGFVKGYLSHANRCIVLSKTDPFPKHVKTT